MSTYIQMWDKVKELTPAQRKDWIRLLEPAQGIGVEFRGIVANDIDILEALRNANEMGV